jgi:hypothetical protein
MCIRSTPSSFNSNFWPVKLAGGSFFGRNMLNKIDTGSTFSGAIFSPRVNMNTKLQKKKCGEINNTRTFHAWVFFHLSIFTRIFSLGDENCRFSLARKKLMKKLLFVFSAGTRCYF